MAAQSDGGPPDIEHGGLLPLFHSTFVSADYDFLGVWTMDLEAA
jgi:hypothetical protein